MPKDFVEHLRSVHFALIGVSVGLIALVSSSKPYNLETALVQLHQIMALQKSWSVDWLQERPIEPETLPMFPTPFGEPGEPILKTKPTEVSGGGFYGEVVLNGQQKSTLVEFSGPVMFDDCESSESFAKTVGEFEAWWNDLTTGCGVYIPQSVSGEGSVEDGKRLVAKIKTFRWPSDEEPEKTPARKMKLGQSTDMRNGKYTLQYVGLSGKYFYRFYIAEAQVLRIRQKEVANRFEGWTEGSFQKTFFDLARATRGLGALEFQDIQKLLSENGTKGSEVFEAFGMKFPARQITLWGVLLILGIQLYLLAYLRQFFRNLVSNDEPSAAWIGLDSSLLGRSMFFTTLVLFPCLAIASLSLSFWYKPFSLWTRGTWEELVGLAIAFVCCISLASSCWANRPCKAIAAKRASS